ncbi:unnamed protein product [Euphydryas editha]|uniref:Uncharacterized protein n=1 Tax=Euphydryas editha TaxID=104508 RepID=A0AAU9TFJ6_EUPED|nr:unnamed protein product [Euphydryas editha]
MIEISFMILSCSLLFSDANYVDTLTKCSIKDTQCMINYFTKVLHDVGSTGIPELNIAPLDPMKLKNTTITIMDSIEITVRDAVIKGLKNCKVNRFRYVSVLYSVSKRVPPDILSIDLKRL